MKKEKIVNIILIITFIFYTVFVVWNILFKYVSPLELFSCERYFSRSINLIPFNDLLEGNYLKLDVWGNIILFIPLGIYLKIKSDKKWSVLAAATALISIIFEIMQYIFAIGASDITDVIYNTVGTLTGILLYKILMLFLKKKEHIKFLTAILALISMLIVLIIVILLFVFN